MGLTVTRPTYSTAASVTQPSWVQHGLLGGTVLMFTGSHVHLFLFFLEGVALRNMCVFPPGLEPACLPGPLEQSSTGWDVSSQRTCVFGVCQHEKKTSARVPGRALWLHSWGDN